jgi:hypothetical protein
MSLPENPPPEHKNDDEQKALNVIQEFNNKKATTHATIFVASMFALFTVLSLAQRIINKSFPSFLCWNTLTFSLSIASYVLIWIFGLYSFFNFSYYSTVAQRAEDQVVKGRDRALILNYIPQWTGLLKKFARFKVPEKAESVQAEIRNSNEGITVIVYILIGLLPLIAFLASLFS